MAELERCVSLFVRWISLKHSVRGKDREKMLERELEKLLGANWQVCHLLWFSVDADLNGSIAECSRI